MRELVITTVSALVLTPILFTGLELVTAQVMQSTNYRLQSDSINVVGGLGTSTSYVLESTGGELASGEASSGTYNLKAGYQQMQEAYIGLSDFSAVTMSPSIPGVSGGTANGSTTVRVTTDSASGYQLTVAGLLSPAMRKGADTIADYVPATSDPDYTFDTGVSDAHFGYSPSGIDVVQRFKDDGASCNTGSSDTALACWDGLDTTAEIVARSTSPNHPVGATTTLYFRVGIGGSVVQAPGTYTATTTLTAVPL